VEIQHAAAFARESPDGLFGVSVVQIAQDIAADDEIGFTAAQFLKRNAAMSIELACRLTRIESLDVRTRGVATREFLGPPARSCAGIGKSPYVESDVSAERDDECDLRTLHVGRYYGALIIMVVPLVVRCVEMFKWQGRPAGGNVIVAARPLQSVQCHWWT
jgi:hypothetical protein